MTEDQRPPVEEVYGGHYAREGYDPSAGVIGGRGLWIAIALIVVVVLLVFAGTTLVAHQLTEAEVGYDGNEDAYRAPTPAR